MANNNTEVVRGVVQPRFYQVYGDLIESKEIMEPLAINAGTGPICGFDWVDTSRPNITITSIFKSNSGAKGLSMLKGKSRRVFLSDKNNNAGQVFNAYTTPDGLCHIAPDTLTFNGMQPSGGWPSTSNPTKLVAFVVKASHTYKPNNSETPPSISNFTCDWLELDFRLLTLSNILKWNYEQVIQALSKSNISFDYNTETIIGLYFIGWYNKWDQDPDSLRLKSIISGFNYVLCLVPIGGRFPSYPFGLNTLDILDIKNRIELLDDSVSSLVPRVNNIQKSFGSNVEVLVTQTKTGDSINYSFNKLNINGSAFVNNKNVVKSLSSSWYEMGDAIGIFISPTVNIDIPTTIEEDSWDIGIVSFSIDENGVMGYGNITYPDQKLDWVLVACVLPRFTDINRDTCIPIGFSNLGSPDVYLAWRLAINEKKLNSKKTVVEQADSGRLTISDNSQHYAYVRAYMGINTLTIRVLVMIYNGGNSGGYLEYPLSTLFQKNSNMSRMMSEIIKMRDSSINGESKLFMSLPTTFKAKDIETGFSSKMDCEIRGYLAYLSINDSSAKIFIRIEGMTAATNGGSDWVKLGHTITIPISDRSEELLDSLK